MSRAWWAVTGAIVVGVIAGGSSIGCSDGATRHGEEREPRAAPRLVDLHAPLTPLSTSPARGSDEPNASGPADPRANVDDPSCQDTCASRRAECGQVCGRPCGECPDGEDCKDNHCECNSTCDGSRCSNDCGEPCACASGLACDASGLCVPTGSCSGPFCAAPARGLPEAPSLPDAPPEPGPF